MEKQKEQQIKNLFQSIQEKEKINQKSLIRIKQITKFYFCFVVQHYHSSTLLHKKGKQYKINFSPDIKPFANIIFSFIDKFENIKVQIQLVNADQIFTEFLQVFGKTKQGKIQQVTIKESSKLEENQNNKQKVKQIIKILKSFPFTEQITIQEKLQYQQLFQIFDQLKFHQIQRKEQNQQAKIYNEFFQKNDKPIKKQQQNEKIMVFLQKELKFQQHQIQKPLCFSSKKKVYDLHLKQINFQKILQFISLWSQQKCLYCQNIQCQKIKTQEERLKKWKIFRSNNEYAFQNQNQLYQQKQCQIPKKLCTQCCKHIPNEVINLAHQKSQILTLNSISEHGYSIYVRKILSVQKFVLGIIPVIFSCKFFISCQIQNILDSITNLLELIFYKYRFHSNYLIKMGHQVQVTSYRLLLNTSGLTQAQIYSILKLMKQPGHYQFICYGDKQYLNQIFQLFKKKPFIKFNFFLPFSQYEENLHNKIKKMQKMADQLKQKVYIFAGLLNNLSIMSINTLQYIFLTLHMSMINDQF